MSIQPEADPTKNLLKEKARELGLPNFGKFMKGMVVAYQSVIFESIPNPNIPILTDAQLTERFLVPGVQLAVSALGQVASMHDADWTSVYKETGMVIGLVHVSHLQTGTSGHEFPNIGAQFNVFRDDHLFLFGEHYYPVNPGRYNRQALTTVISIIADNSQHIIRHEIFAGFDGLYMRKQNYTPPTRH